VEIVVGVLDVVLLLHAGYTVVVLSIIVVLIVTIAEL